MTATPRFRALAAGATMILLATARPAFSEEAVRIEERFAGGDRYSVKSRSEVSGTLSPPAEKGKPAPPPVTMRGYSAIEYDERVLAVTGNGQVQKTIRISRRADFQRTVDERPEKSSLRPAVRRLVLLREGPLRKAPFSPDGPLTWGEIDIIRTDVFVPALGGLFPSGAVKAGDSWSASAEAVQELTGLAGVDEGRLECRLEQVMRRQARVTVSGTVRGTTEDGSSRQQLKGHFLFDLDAGRLVYLEIRGTHFLLAADGHEVGRIDGRFVLSRQPAPNVPELDDEALRGVDVVPGADNTLLLYDNADLGVRFLYPRRWKVAGSGGNQVAVDAPDGSGFLLTVEPAGRTPTAAQFMKESTDFLQGQKARVLRVDQPQTVQANPPREHFSLEIDMGGQKFVMDYHVSRQALGGVIIAARLLPAARAELQRELEGIARTVVVTKRIEGRK